MTDRRKQDYSGWITAVLSILILLGSGIAVYADIKADLAVVKEKAEATQKELASLDTYDAHLTSRQEELETRVVKFESRQEAIEKTQIRLESTMAQILAEMKIMNENIIRLSK